MPNSSDNLELGQRTKMITIALGTIGTLSFIAAGLNVVPSKIGIFIGIACFIIAGMVRKMSEPEG